MNVITPPPKKKQIHKLQSNKTYFLAKLKINNSKNLKVQKVNQKITKQNFQTHILFQHEKEKEKKKKAIRKQNCSCGVPCSEIYFLGQTKQE